MTESKLLDLNDCSGSYARVHDEMLKIGLSMQRAWFRPVVKRSRFIQNCVGHNHWSRAWEYPWAIEAAELPEKCKVLDVGGGGSPVADYLSKKGHDCSVIDPSLKDEGARLRCNDKSIYRNIRSHVFHAVIDALRINKVWGLHSNLRKSKSVKYFDQQAQCIRFPDNYFDRVLCLSVIEHIPHQDWKNCIMEFERVLRPRGRLIITLDMDIRQANDRLYSKLVEYCSLKLIGDPRYDVPISDEDRARRHGHFYETIGLVWQA